LPLTILRIDNASIAVRRNRPLTPLLIGLAENKATGDDQQRRRKDRKPHAILLPEFLQRRIATKCAKGTWILRPLIDIELQRGHREGDFCNLSKVAQGCSL
jgi:hypothetical protein